jgi:hypothetical protein
MSEFRALFLSLTVLPKFPSFADNLARQTETPASHITHLSLSCGPTNARTTTGPSTSLAYHTLHTAAAAAVPHTTTITITLTLSNTVAGS